MASYPCILIRFISYGMKWSDPGILTNQDCIFHWCFFCSSTWKWLKDWKLQTLPRLFRVMVSWSLFFFNRKFDVKLAGCTAWKINIYIYMEPKHHAQLKRQYHFPTIHLHDLGVPKCEMSRMFYTICFCRWASGIWRFYRLFRIGISPNISGIWSDS